MFHIWLKFEQNRQKRFLEFTVSVTDFFFFFTGNSRTGIFEIRRPMGLVVLRRYNWAKYDTNRHRRYWDSSNSVFYSTSKFGVNEKNAKSSEIRPTYVQNLIEIGSCVWSVEYSTQDGVFFDIIRKIIFLYSRDLKRVIYISAIIIHHAEDRQFFANLKIWLRFPT